MKNKMIWVVILVIVVVFSIIFIQRSNSKTVKSLDSMRAGVILPLSGNFAVLGERMKNGFEMAREDISNTPGTVNVELKVEDACFAKDAVSAVQKLIQNDKIDVLGGSFCLVGFVPSLPILEQNKIIAFNTAANPDLVLNKKYVFSTQSSIKEKATKIVGYAVNTLHAKTAAIIYYNTPLGLDYNKYLTQVFESNGGKVLSSEITLVDATDFRTQLAKIKQSKADVLFIIELAKPLGNLLTQANQIGVASALVGTSENEDPTIIETAGKAAEGFIIPSDEPLPKTKKIIGFEKRYQEKYGQKPDTSAYNAYDALWIENNAYKQCSGDTECMVNYLHTIKDYQGVSGIITISDDGSAFKPTIFKVVKDGKFVQVAK